MKKLSGPPVNGCELSRPASSTPLIFDLVGAPELAVAADRHEQLTVLEVVHEVIETSDLEVEAHDGR